MKTRILQLVLVAVSPALVACADPLSVPTTSTIAAIGASWSVQIGADLVAQNTIIQLGPEIAVAKRQPSRAVLAAPLTYWPFSLSAPTVDGTATVGDTLLLASEVPSKRPLLDPVTLSIDAVGADGTQTRRWHAAALGASPMALSSAGTSAVAVWSQRAYPGRQLALVHLTNVGGGDGETKERAVVRTLDAGDPNFRPVDQPMVHATDDGWVACSRSAVGPPRCAHYRNDGTVVWEVVKSLNSYPPWKLVPRDGGFFLVAASCKVESCRRPRVVVQPLDTRGRVAGRMRIIAVMQGRRGLGVFPVEDGVLLYGRRRVAKHATALVIHNKGVTELDGYWDRIHGGVSTNEGALLMEVSTLSMRDGRPVQGWRPRRWSASAEAEKVPEGKRDKGGRYDAERWPDAVVTLLHDERRQAIRDEHGLLTIHTLPRAGERTLTGVTMRPGFVPPPVEEQSVETLVAAAAAAKIASVKTGGLDETPIEVAARTGAAGPVANMVNAPTVDIHDRVGEGILVKRQRK
ncbi:MAG: hypothetical protein ACI9MR_004780 [Myxococcota bacterium]